VYGPEVPQSSPWVVQLDPSAGHGAPASSRRPPSTVQLLPGETSGGPHVVTHRNPEPELEPELPPELEPELEPPQTPGCGVSHPCPQTFEEAQPRAGL
jgi:hypothetical protein